jgi:hypothetical protein
LEDIFSPVFATLLWVFWLLREREVFQRHVRCALAVSKMQQALSGPVPCLILGCLPSRATSTGFPFSKKFSQATRAHEENDEVACLALRLFFYALIGA